MRPEQPIYKDLTGDRDGQPQIKNFIFNPKAADPVGSDRTPEELYINTTDKLVKHYDDSLDLRYLVPGVVKMIAPTELDIDYEVGTEWKLSDGSETYKLLGIDSYGDAVWLPLKAFEPLKLVTANLQFYVDDAAGVDTNRGTAAEPFKTINGAIAFINSTYDFNNGKYNYTINVVGPTQSTPITRLEKPVGADNQQFNIVGVNPETELVLTQAHCFICNDDFVVNIKNFSFVGSAGKQSAIFGAAGRLTVQDCTFKSNFNRAFWLNGNLRVTSKNNVIEDVGGQALLYAAYRSEFYQTNNFLARGTNSFTYLSILHDYAIAHFHPASDLTLDAGATVTGSKFAKFNSSQLRIYDVSYFKDWGNTPGVWNSLGGAYRNRHVNHNYSHWVIGLELSLNGSDLELSEGEALLLFAQGDKDAQRFHVNVYQPQVISFPAILASQNEAWVYAADNETIEFLSVPPDPDNLEFRVCLGKVTTTDNATFASVDAFIKERSPEFLDSLNAPGVIASCVIANAATNTLNGTFAGSVVPLDPATFSTSSPNYTITGNAITVADAGIYKIEADLNCSVPTTGTQRPSVGVRIAINGLQKMKAGRSGYIRRASGHLRGSSFVSARANLNPGDTISVIGFRDAAGGIVDAFAGESELMIMKLT